MSSKMLLSIIIIAFTIVSCTDDNGSPGGSGLIETTEITISSETAGKCLTMMHAEGDRVLLHDTLAVIDTTNTILALDQTDAALRAGLTKQEMAQIAIEQARHGYELAKKEYERANSLLKSGSANQQQYDRAENAYIQADLNRKQADISMATAKADISRIRAEIAILNEQLSNCVPVSPCEGIITSKYIDAGELVTPGRALYKIAVLDTVWAKIYVPSKDLTKIQLGSTAEIDPEDGRAEPIKGTVSWISSEAEFTPKNVQTKEARADLVYAVKVTIPNMNHELKVGMPVSVVIP